MIQNAAAVSKSSSSHQFYLTPNVFCMYWSEN